MSLNLLTFYPAGSSSESTHSAHKFPLQLLECLSKSELLSSESLASKTDDLTSHVTNLQIDFQWKPNVILKNKDKYFDFVIRDKDSYWIFKRKQGKGGIVDDSCEIANDRESALWERYEQLADTYQLSFIHGLIDQPSAMLFFKSNAKYTGWRRLFARHFLCQRAEIELTQHKNKGFLCEISTQSMSSEVLSMSSTVKRRSRTRSSEFVFTMDSLTEQSELVNQTPELQKSPHYLPHSGSMRIELEQSDDGEYRVIQRSRLRVQMADAFGLNPDVIEEDDGADLSEETHNNPHLFTIHGAEFSTHQMARPFFADSLFFLKRRDGKDIASTYTRDAKDQTVQALEVWLDAEHLWSRMAVPPPQKYALDSRRLFLFYLIVYSLLFQSMRDAHINIPVLHFHQKRQWIFEKEVLNTQFAAYRYLLSRNDFGFKTVVFVGKNDKDSLYFSQVFDPKASSPMLCPALFVKNKNPLEIASELCSGTSLNVALLNDGQYKFGTPHAFDPPTIPRDHDSEFETFLAHYSSAFFTHTPELNPRIFHHSATHEYTQEQILNPIIGDIPTKDIQAFLGECLQFMHTIEQ